MRRAKVFGLSVAIMIVSVAAAAVTANAFTGQTTRVSVNSAGDAANAGATNGVLSADGRYVVFQSSSTNLVAGVSGVQVYRHEVSTGVTVPVSVATTGAGGNGVSRDPSISADGRFVVFSSFATDLVDGDTNLASDVFVRDVLTGVTTLVSAGATGVSGNLGSGLSGVAGAHEISDDGRFVAFTSLATNLVAESNNGVQQIYVKDRNSGAIVRASVTAADSLQAGNAASQSPAISGNGRVVAFSSAATNLVPPSNTTQIFVRDLVAGTTTLESAGAVPVGRPSTVPSLSFDGRYLAFVSEAALDARDLDNGTPDVFLRDRVAGTTVLASVSPTTLGGAFSLGPSISADGRWVGFHSLDDKIVVPDVGGFFDVFLYDRDTQAVIIVSRNDAGDQANASSFGASVASDGHLVLFGSTASNLAVSAGAGNQLYLRSLASLNQAPVLPPVGPVDLVEAQPLHLTGSFTDNDGSTSWTARVDYGDGSGVQPLALNANKTFALDHLYMPGAYDLTVAVTDDAGATGSLVIRVAVSNVRPTVNLPTSLDLAFTQTLDASGTFTDPGSNEAYTATVDYGDGSGAQPLVIGPFDASPLVGGSFALHHNYAAAGLYNVAVSVADGRTGGVTTANLAVNVRGFSFDWQDPVAGGFTVGRNLPVKFTVHGPDGAFVLDPTVQVDVLDGTGAVVAGPFVLGDQPSRSVMVSGDSYHVNVDTRNLAAGAYLLRARFSSPVLTGEVTLATNGSGGPTRSRVGR